MGSRGCPLRGVGRVDRDNPIGVWERQPLEQPAVHDAKDGRAQSDADTERENGAE
jgi:hypothetical protein